MSTPDYLQALASLATVAAFCFIVAGLSAQSYRWTRERQDADRARRLAELRAYAALLACTKGQGVEA